MLDVHVFKKLKDILRKDIKVSVLSYMVEIKIDHIKILIIDSNRAFFKKVEENVFLYGDLKFLGLKSFIKGTVDEEILSNDDYIYFKHLNSLLKILSKNTPKNEKNYLLRSVFHYELKKFFYERFKLKENPDNLIFCYNGSEIDSVYRKKCKRRSGQVVKVVDSTALLIERADGSRYVGFCFLWKDKDYVYFDRDAFQYIKTPKGIILRPRTDIDLTKTKRARYRKIQEEIFILRKKDFEYYLEDKGVYYSINHPDLMLLVID